MNPRFAFKPLVAWLLGAACFLSHAADFAINSTASGSDSNLNLSATLTTASTDVGQRGEIYLVALLGNNVFFHNGSTWLPTLAPYKAGILDATLIIPIVGGLNLTAFQGLSIYLGYGTSITEMLSAGRYQKVYTVTGERAYIQGELAGQDAWFIQSSNSAAKATGALMQAILAVNSVLYTDPSVSDVSTFKERKAAADTALAVLEKYALETETSLDSPLSVKSKSVTKAISPEEVLATVAAGNSKTQLKTLMTKYKVGAKEAKTMLDNAMAGLISDYNADAKFFDTAARTATLVKEGSGLALTIVGTAVSAGGVAGAISIGEAALTLVSGADAAIKVTKAGLELIKGADIPQPKGTAGAIITTLSDANEVIALTNLRKWTDPQDVIANWVTLEQKRADALSGGEINLGAHTYTISPLTQERLAQVDALLRPPLGQIPVTMTGKYKIAGVVVDVPALPQVLKDTIAMLPDADRIPDIVNKTPATSSNITIGSISLKYQAYASPFDASCYSDSSFVKPSYSFSGGLAIAQQNGGSITQTGNGHFVASCTSRCSPTITCDGSVQGNDTASATVTLSCKTTNSGMPLSFVVTAPVDVSSAPLTHVSGTYTVYKNGATGPNAQAVPCNAALSISGTASFRSAAP